MSNSNPESSLLLPSQFAFDLANDIVKKEMRACLDLRKKINQLDTSDPYTCDLLIDLNSNPKHMRKFVMALMDQSWETKFKKLKFKISQECRQPEDPDSHSADQVPAQPAKSSNDSCGGNVLPQQMSPNQMQQISIMIQQIWHQNNIIIQQNNRQENNQMALMSYQKRQYETYEYPNTGYFNPPRGRPAETRQWVAGQQRPYPQNQTAKSLGQHISNPLKRRALCNGPESVLSAAPTNSSATGGGGCFNVPPGRHVETRQWVSDQQNQYHQNQAASVYKGVEQHISNPFERRALYGPETIHSPAQTKSSAAGGAILEISTQVPTHEVQKEVVQEAAIPNIPPGFEPRMDQENVRLVSQNEDSDENTAPDHEIPSAIENEITAQKSQEVAESENVSTCTPNSTGDNEEPGNDTPLESQDQVSEPEAVSDQEHVPCALGNEITEHKILPQPIVESENVSASTPNPASESEEPVNTPLESQAQDSEPESVPDQEHVPSALGYQIAEETSNQAVIEFEKSEEVVSTSTPNPTADKEKSVKDISPNLESAILQENNIDSSTPTVSVAITIPKPETIAIESLSEEFKEQFPSLADAYKTRSSKRTPQERPLVSQTGCSISFGQKFGAQKDAVSFVASQYSHSDVFKPASSDRNQHKAKIPANKTGSQYARGTQKRGSKPSQEVTMETHPTKREKKDNKETKESKKPETSTATVCINKFALLALPEETDNSVNSEDSKSVSSPPKSHHSTPGSKKNKKRNESVKEQSSKKLEEITANDLSNVSTETSATSPNTSTINNATEKPSSSQSQGCYVKKSKQNKKALKVGTTMDKTKLVSNDVPVAIDVTKAPTDTVTPSSSSYSATITTIETPAQTQTELKDSASPSCSCVLNSGTIAIQNPVPVHADADGESPELATEAASTSSPDMSKSQRKKAAKKRMDKVIAEPEDLQDDEKTSGEANVGNQEEKATEGASTPVDTIADSDTPSSSSSVDSKTIQNPALAQEDVAYVAPELAPEVVPATLSKSQKKKAAKKRRNVERAGNNFDDEEVPEDPSLPENRVNVVYLGEDTEEDKLSKSQKKRAAKQKFKAMQAGNGAVLDRRPPTIEEVTYKMSIRLSRMLHELFEGKYRGSETPSNRGTLLPVYNHIWKRLEAQIKIIPDPKKMIKAMNRIISMKTEDFVWFYNRLEYPNGVPAPRKRTIREYREQKAQEALENNVFNLFHHANIRDGAEEDQGESSGS